VPLKGCQGEGSGGAQVPELEHRVLVVSSSGHEMETLVRVPCDVRDTAARGVFELTPDSKGGMSKGKKDKRGSETMLSFVLDPTRCKSRSGRTRPGYGPPESSKRPW
jgi:hypothetical protein